MSPFVCNFNPTLLELPGPLSLRWYGLAYLLAFLLVLYLVPYQLHLRHQPFSRRHISDLLFYLFLSMLLGARLGHTLFYNLPTFLSDPLEFFRLWHGGMSFHGGVLGLVISGVLLAPRYSLSRLLLADLLILPASLALVFGRLANFINCELWGRPSSLPWSIIFPRADLTPRHPAQLYGALGYLFSFLLLFLYLRHRPRPGRLFFLGLLLLSLVRGLNEFFRAPDYYLLPHLTIGQALSLPLILISLFGLFYLTKKHP